MFNYWFNPLKFLRNILLPFVPVYGAITWVRNYAYDHDFLESKAYDFPLICVGNLSVGGTGKTPMIEYLIRLLHTYRVATLSRGYKRTTKGFVIANEDSNASSIGDEPFQFYTKFKNITVAVDANRQHGIQKLRSLTNPPEVILLDDAYQHRKVKAGFNILLTSYEKLYVDDMSLPTGDLREPISGAKRADVIIVTKCPVNLDNSTKMLIKKKLKIEKNQALFFSSITYANNVYALNTKMAIGALANSYFTLVTGIANPDPLVTYLEGLGLHFEHLNFSDHHKFSKREIEHLRDKELILTTEKDYTRLADDLDADKLFYLPIEVSLDDETSFNELVENFVQEY